MIPKVVIKPVDDYELKPWKDEKNNMTDYFNYGND